MDHETDRPPARRRRKPGEPDQGGCTGAVAGRASTPAPQSGMTQFYATSFISAWHFLHERLRSSPRQVSASCSQRAGEALRVLRLVPGRPIERAGDADENRVTPPNSEPSNCLALFPRQLLDFGV